MGDEVVVIKAPARHTLEELARRAAPVLRAAGVRRAVVFGSWARGTADGYSDLDLAVVADMDLPKEELGRAFASVIDAIPVGVDLLVYTPEEFARGMAEGYGVFDAIAREGVTIYPEAQD